MTVIRQGPTIQHEPILTQLCHDVYDVIGLLNTF